MKSTCRAPNPVWMPFLVFFKPFPVVLALTSKFSRQSCHQVDANRGQAPLRLPFSPVYPTFVVPVLLVDGSYYWLRRGQGPWGFPPRRARVVKRAWRSSTDIFICILPELCGIRSACHLRLSASAYVTETTRHSYAITPHPFTEDGLSIKYLPGRLKGSEIHFCGVTGNGHSGQIRYNR